MRFLAIAAMLAMLGCTSEPESQPQTAQPTSFDGAQVVAAKARVAHGERLSRVLGCRGCHGDDLQGERFYELYASNLTRDVASYNDDQLKRLLRQGSHPTGRDVWGMPSELFQHLSVADEAALINYLRTLTPAGQPTQPRLPWSPEVEKMIAEGKIKPANATVRETGNVGPVDLGSRYALGRYIARVTCAECHGPKLEGGDTPDLIAAGGYNREEFDTLVTRGVPTNNRKLHELMVDVAKRRFAHLTKNERDELYAYLKARAERPT